ncbi:MAG: esterase [Thiotrichales bacterium]|nr:esterase [Thiotrichales bacterium]|tara:strand:+ start:3095 stop:3958 length:864 start_codon:yes stop_codon:yes gene_type:complete
MDFEKMTDEQQHALNLEYRAKMTIPDADDYVKRAAERSSAVRNSLQCHLDVRYGDGPKQTLDVFPATHAGGPVFFYIHGGYWFQLDKDIYSEVASPMVAAGATTVLPNYDLCPDVTIPDIVDQVRHALVWVYANIAAYGGDPERIHISGHSAGGHLTGMMMTTDWAGQFGLPQDLIKGSTPISGLFDIKPHRHTNLQPYIQLTAEAAATNSPQFLPLHCSGPVICAVGGGETQSFKRQSREFSEKCQTSGLESQYVEVAADHHFAVTDRLNDQDDPLTKSIIAQMGL